MEDTQVTEASEQVEQSQESTTLSFGQDANSDNDTHADSTGQVENNISSWEEDKRFKEHWGEDPNKMYESLKYHEKRQGDYDKQVADYKSQVEDLGRYRDDYNALEQLFEHPELGKKLINVINEHKNPTQNVQGQHQPSQIDDLRSQVEQLSQFKNDLDQRAMKQYKEQQEQQQFEQIDDFAKKYNISYDKQDFLKAMEGQNADPSSWIHYFKSQASDIAMKNAANRAAESALNNKKLAPSFSSSEQKLSSGRNGQNVDQLLDEIFKK